MTRGPADALEEQFGDRVETAYIENVPEGPDAERVIRDFAQRGYDLIITTSFGYMDPTATVAAEYPRCLVRPRLRLSSTADNLSTICSAGCTSPASSPAWWRAKATQTNRIGYVAAFPIPEVIRGINAFTLRRAHRQPRGHRPRRLDQHLVRPARGEGRRRGPPRPGRATSSPSTRTPPSRRRPPPTAVAFSIGYDSDMSRLCRRHGPHQPGLELGSPSTSRSSEGVLDGTYTTESYWGGLEDGIVGLAELSPLGQGPGRGTAALVDEVRAPRSWQRRLGRLLRAGQAARAASLAVARWRTCLTDEEMLNLELVRRRRRRRGPRRTRPRPRHRSAADLPSAAFVYVGPTGDLGWTYAHDQGRLALEATGVETAYAELVAEGPDSARVVRDFAQKGYDVVFATSFGFMDSVIEPWRPRTTPTPSLSTAPAT
jgi:basic membrane lipoprotein Med (substrate-binding protein (PBP1-ABC) superfamily)